MKGHMTVRSDSYNLSTIILLDFLGKLGLSSNAILDIAVLTRNLKKIGRI
jgi:hypothetical protein